uniref:Bone marrow stromal antigen 2 n=1 Tax=Bos mutus grunniens TaxID=30521 RepID=A0A8B9YSI7_BOSMU
MDTEEDMSEFVMPIDKEKDSSESALCGRKLPLWLGLLLLLAAVGLLVPMIYFAVIANSKACVDGLQAQKECQEVNQHVQRQLTQAQELLNEKKAEAATCKQAVVTLRDSLKTEQARVEELQGEKNPLDPWGPQPEFPDFYSRRKSEASAEDYPSRFSVLFFPAFLAGVVMTAGVLITCKCLKK